MKKKYLHLLLLTTPLLFAILSFSSCGGDDDEGNEVLGVSIVGEWKFDHGTHYGNDGEVQWVEYCNLIFNADRTYNENKRYKGESVIYAEGKWFLGDSKLTFQMTYAKYGSEEYKDINQKVTYTVVKLNKRELALDDGDVIYYFKRK